MSVLNPRNRLVNFRLSEIEFEKLKAACSRQGARSISDFARTSVLRNLDDQLEVAPPPYGHTSNLGQKVAELEIRVDQLLRLVGAVSRTQTAQTTPAPITAEGGDLQHN